MELNVKYVAKYRWMSRTCKLHNNISKNKNFQIFDFTNELKS